VIQDNHILKTRIGVQSYGMSQMVIQNNYFYQNYVGVSLLDSFNSTISNNIFIENNISGIGISYTKNCNILNNHIIGNKTDNIEDSGIEIVFSSGNNIIGNIISDSYSGLNIHRSSKNQIVTNNIENYVFIICSRDNIISKNNLYSGAYFFAELRYGGFMNIWDKNYWGEPKVLPYPILGTYRFSWQDKFIDFKILNFDWDPASEPYDIP
jgi:parallel beta-helix repeat protein